MTTHISTPNGSLVFTWPNVFTGPPATVQAAERLLEDLESSLAYPHGGHPDPEGELGPTLAALLGGRVAKRVGGPLPDSTPSDAVN